ncbi:MAG: DUF333 domain-containing protein [Bdellovibrio sp.]|nr:DUF333 domain-containing protein [Bdellovibrio sp.]
MLKIILVISILVVSSYGHSAGAEFKYYVNGQYKSIVIVKIDGLNFNSSCLKETSCKALRISRGVAFKIHETNSSLAGNPGANYCWDVGAKNRILKDSKNNEYDFCVFDDGSMIDAWNLYAKHYPPKRIE